MTTIRPKRIVYYTQTDAVNELNRVMSMYDALVADYNELLMGVKTFIAVEAKLRRIQAVRLKRVEALEDENERLWWAAQHALAWKEENEHLWKILEATDE